MSFPFSEYLTVKEYAKMHQVSIGAVYRWIKLNQVPYAICPYMGRKIYLVRSSAPRPIKKTTLPHWLHPGLEGVPSGEIIVVEAEDPQRPPAFADDDPPWHDNQIHMEDLL